MKLKKEKKEETFTGQLNLCAKQFMRYKVSEGSTVKMVSIAILQQEGREFESISWVKFSCFPHIRMGSLQVQLVGLG